MAIITKILNIVVTPAIQVLLGVAVLYFVWGVWVFVRNADSPDKRQEGASHILYATIGIFIMISVFGIMNLIQNSFGLH